MPKNNVILPGKTIGIIGGGQLGRMMAIAAKYMGYKIAVLDPTPNCPTAQVADQQITAAYDDLAAIAQLTEVSDVVTYEFENVDLKAAEYIEDQGKLPQGAKLLAVTQNRDQEKALMTDLQVPVAPYVVIDHEDESEAAVEQIGFPAVIKTCHGGYDGKGQLKINSHADLPDVKRFVREQGQRCIIEKWITFDREISAVFTRSLTGDIEFFPIAENKHHDQILVETIVPARIEDEIGNNAREAAADIAEELQVVGTFAIEMFVSDGEIFVNEMAPRPHNSGHYTIEGCSISQFAQHIHAICGLPLQKAKLREPTLMVNILGEQVEPLLKAMPKLQDGSVHLYGKADVKEKRKMGHVTFTAETESERDEIVAHFKETIMND